MTIVGLDISSSDIIPALINEGGGLISALPDRLAPGSSSELPSQIAEFRERLTQHFRAVEIETVIVVDVDLSRTSPSSVRKRSYLEASVFLAAHDVEAVAFFVHQQAIASSVGLEPRSSKDLIRDKVISMMEEDVSLLSPEPIRRARALGAAWTAINRQGVGLT